MNSMRNIAIFDYGVGNIGSIQKLFIRLGHKTVVTSNIEVLMQSEMVILPGVGSAKHAINSLSQIDGISTIRKIAFSGKPIIGICLGAQLLFEYLCESESRAISLMRGSVIPLEPHGRVNTGWRELNHTDLKRLGISTGLKQYDSYFFNHEYFIQSPLESNCQLIATNDGVPAILNERNVWAIQFHPEKSQKQGEIILRNIIGVCFGK